MTDSHDSSVEGKWGTDRTLKPSAPTKSDGIIGQILFDRFEVLDLLGEGAMASVFKANDRASGRMVALKKVSSDDPDTLNRFAREVKLHGSLKHENIVEAIDCLTDDSGRTFS